MLLQKHLHGRINKILALVPRHRAPSEASNKSDSDEELHVPPSPDSYFSSPAPSIASSLELLNLLDSDENERERDDEPLPAGFSSILQEVFPSPSQEPVYSNLPSMSSLPSLPTPPSVAVTVRRKRRSKVPVVVAKKAKKPKKKFSMTYKWKKVPFQHRVETLEDDFEDLNIQEIESPLEYFYKFFSRDIIEHIVSETNIYSTQCTGKSIQLTEEEFCDFLAIHILMGIVGMPSYIDYWSTKFRYPLIANLMSLKRYEKIRRYIHFADNNYDDGDRYYKIRPIVEKIRNNCLAQETERRFSIDEMMIAYKGTKAGKRRQYMKDKPNKWGFKNYVRAGISGMIYDFVLYGGEDTFRFHRFSEEEETLGFGAQIVLALCQSIKRRPAMVFFDNFFTSPEVLYILRQNYGIFALGTVRNNRLRGAENVLTSEKMLKKKERGSYSQVVCNNNKLAVVRWNDNKCVTLISSYTDSEPVQKIKRYSKDAKRKVDVDCPNVVKDYNKHMGGVDLADMLVSLYKTPFKTRRWYIGIFAQLIDICINNAWILYRKHHSQRKSEARLKLKLFRYEIFSALIKMNKSAKRTNQEETTIRKPCKPRPVDCVRFDNIGHFLSTKEEGRCMECTKKTTVFCIKCDVRVCFVTGKNPRNCHLKFHTK